MGRKDLTEERTAEILDAFARSIVRYGLDVSLDQVAQEAGMTRSIIRHYIGNREEVLNTLVEQIAQAYVEELQNAAGGIAQADAVAATLDYLFAEEAGYDDYELLVFNVIMTAKERYPQAKRTITWLFETLIDMFSEELCAAYPHADAVDCRQIAYSVIALAMSNDSLLWLGMNRDYNIAARMGAEALIRTLESSAKMNVVNTGS